MKSYTKYRKRKKVQEKTKCSKTRQITTSAFTKSRCIISIYHALRYNRLHFVALASCLSGERGSQRKTG